MRADGIDVGADIQPLTAQLLRRGKLRRALDGGHLARLRDVGREHRDRQAEIADLHRAVGFDEAIRRLHVPVEDAARQRGVEARHHLQDRVDRGRRRHRPVAVDDVLQRAARHEFHRNDGVAAELFTAEDEDRIRMIEGSRQLAFAKEPRAVVGTREPLVQHLERHAAAVLEVLGFVDLPHPASAEEACDPVRADDLRDGEAGTVAPGIEGVRTWRRQDGRFVVARERHRASALERLEFARSGRAQVVRFRLAWVRTLFRSIRDRPLPRAVALARPRELREDLRLLRLLTVEAANGVQEGDLAGSAVSAAAADLIASSSLPACQAFILAA